MASLGDMVVRIRGDMTDFNRAIDASETRFRAATANFQKLGTNLTKFVTVPILGIGAAAVKAAADMEMQEAAFETMLGSAEKAKDLLQELNTLAAKTPFQMTDLAEATKTMLAFGIAQEEVLPNLQMLGDIAGGNSDKLRSLTLAFSQIQSTGRLMGQDLLQLINAGFNPLQTIAEKTGKTMAELKKDMENGAISAEMVSEAFKIATSEGGRFFGGMERASLTLKGQFSTLLDNIMMLGRGLGDVLLPPLKNIVTATTEIVQKFTAMDGATRTAVVQYGLLAAAIGPVILGVLQLIKILPQLKIAMAFLSANPIILGISAVAAGIAVVAIESKKAATQAKALQDALSGAADIDAIQQSLALKRQEIELQKEIIRGAKGSIAEQALAQAQGKEALANLEAQERQLVANLNGKRQNIIATEAQNKAAIALADTEAAKARLEQQAAEAKRINDQSQAESIAEQLLASEALIAKLQEEILLNQTAHEATTEQTEAEIAQIEEKIYATQDYGTTYKDTLSDIQAGEIALAEVLAQLDEERKAREVDWQTLQTQGFTAVLQGFADVGAAIVDGELGWKTFARAGLNALASVLDALGAQLAAMAALNFFGKPPNITAGVGATAGSVAAFTAAGGIRAAATQLAEGGVVMPTPGGTLAQIAEAGQPEAVIPLDRFGEFGGDIHLVVNLDSKPFLDKIFPATRNRTILISAGAVV
jgi:tape measure domain-containing protein